MNPYKNLMFLLGHFTDPRMDDGHDEGYGRRYGNRVANARALREPWDGRGRPAVPPPDDVEPCRHGAAG